MGAPEEARLRDAIDYMKEAEKNTEKGWFKKPDWDIAAQYFEKAGQAFKAGKSYEQSIQAFIKTSDSMISATSLFMAGRAMENAANIALQNLGQPERAAEMYKRASELFMQNAAPDRAAEMLEKSAKAMEPISVDSAIESYIGACNIYESEDRARFATDTFKRTISLLVKHKRFEKAIEVLQRLGNIQKETPNKTAYYKTLLSIVIIYLAAGDEVEAGKRFQAYCGEEGFTRSEESAIAHAMLDAFEHHDQAYYNQTANRQHVGFLDNEVARLARNIVISNDLISGGGYIEPTQPSIPHPRQQQHQRLQQQQQLYKPQQPPQQLFQNHGPALASAMNTNPFQPKSGPYSSPQSFGQDEIYRAGPVPGRSDLSQQRPSSISSDIRYDEYRPSSVPPPYTDVRSESDWRALTDKPNTSTSSPPQLNHQQARSNNQSPQPRNNQQGGAQPSQNYYQDFEDGDDGLL
ncbi:hypothetical protein BGZ76_007345 [Entomortierella beljakovae]|nr:hypothetical protein BGZ76_007345 [Entomortierella beljakovae]